MTTTARLTISVPEGIAAKAQRAVAAGQADSVSGYFADLASREPDWADAEATVNAMIEETGGLSAEARSWARDLLHGRGDGAAPG